MCNMRLLQSGTAFRYYKVRQIFLQSETALFFISQNDSVTKWDRYYKVGQFYHKAGQILQSGTIITKWALTDVFTLQFLIHILTTPVLYGLRILGHSTDYCTTKKAIRIIFF